MGSLVTLTNEHVKIEKEGAFQDMNLRLYAANEHCSIKVLEWVVQI